MTVASDIIVILGPTASGKTALSIAVAQALGAEILSIDSMQVYRGMNVGTAKPTLEERAGVVHHLIDVVAPDETYAVSQFVESADRVIADCAARRVPLVATGGTPMYYKSLFEGLFEGPGADAELRAKLASESPELLHARLAVVDPDAARRIHVNDQRRLVRAMEVYELTGRSITSLQNEWGATPRHAAMWFGLNWEKEELNRRINVRTKQMIATGWVDEVRQLLDTYAALSMTAAEATGYRELIDHVRHGTSLDDACEQIKIATRQLARRQMKWFRRWQQVQWLDGSLEASTLLGSILGKVNG